MAKNNSDNTMLILAIIAVAVSAVAFLVSAGLFGGLTGYATASGNVNATVSSTASIALNVSSIQFGSGQIVAGQGGVILDSNFTGGQTTPYPTSGTFNRTNISNNGDGRTRGGIIVENNGNSDINLQVNLDSATTISQALCQGLSQCTGGTPLPNFQLMWTNNRTGSCAGGSQPENSYFVPTVGNSITGPWDTLCGATNFKWNTLGQKGRVEVNAKITLNDQTPPHTINAILNFQGS